MLINVNGEMSLQSEKAKERKCVRRYDKEVLCDEIFPMHDRQREQYPSDSYQEDHTSNHQKVLEWVDPVISIEEQAPKLCRRKHVNHSERELNVKAWSVLEDALLWQLYYSSGSKWSEISQLLKGRTDSAIKNRFHQIQGVLEKDIKKCTEYYKDNFQTNGQKQGGKQYLYFSSESKDYSVKVMKLLEHLAIGSLKGTDNAKIGLCLFGPMRSVDSSGEICRRCGLFAPSVQTGRTLCAATGWYNASTLYFLY